jgi:hypothetical protein
MGTSLTSRKRNDGKVSNEVVFCCRQLGGTEGEDGGVLHDTKERSGSLTMDG